MKNVSSHIRAIGIGLVLCIGLMLGALGVGRAVAGSPPTMAWVSQTGSITGGTTATIITATSGTRIVLYYAEFNASTATAMTIQEHPTSGGNINIATIGLGSALNPAELRQNDYFGGGGYITAAGSSVVLIPTSTATISGSIRYELN